MKLVKGEAVTGADLAGRTLVLGNRGDFVSLVQCNLQNCHVIVDSDEGAGHLYQSVFDRCRIEYKHQLKDVRLFTNAFHRCDFRGRFHGVDFGRSPDPDPLTDRPDELGAVIECDFSEAELDWCRFFVVDVSRQRFAPWPQFVIPYERKLAAFRRHDVWPGKLERYISLSETEDPSLSASASLATTIQKRYDINEDELRQALETIGGVIG